MASNVPRNKLQSRLLHQQRQILAPGTGTIHSVTGIILVVYDQETIEAGNVPKQVQSVLDSRPGALVAKVLTANDQLLYLLFKETPDQIFSTYGDALQLQGTKCKIEFSYQDIESGTVVPLYSVKNKVLNLQKAVEVYDIGSL